jgi:hypothetical protein
MMVYKINGRQQACETRSKVDSGFFQPHPIQVLEEKPFIQKD